METLYHYITISVSRIVAMITIHAPIGLAKNRAVNVATKLFSKSLAESGQI